MVAFAGADLGVIHLNFRKANCKISQLLYMYESMVVQSYDTSAICLSDEVFGWLQAVVDDELSSSILVAFAIIMFSLMVFTFLVPVCSLSSNPSSSFLFLHNLPLNHKVCIQFWSSQMECAANQMEFLESSSVESLKFFRHVNSFMVKLWLFL